MKLHRLSIDVLRWVETAVKSAIEMALWLLRHQRSFPLPQQECIKIRHGQKDYVDVSLELPSLTETKLGQTLCCLAQSNTVPFGKHNLHWAPSLQ